MASPFRRPPPIKTVNIPKEATMPPQSTNTALLYPSEFTENNSPVQLWNAEEIAASARELLNKLLQNSVPTGNLYSGGLGSYYLLLEYCDFLEANAARNTSQAKTSKSPARTSSTHRNGPIHAFQYKKEVESPLTSPSNSPTHSASTPSNAKQYYSPIRCKRLIQQALDATQQALEKFNTQHKHSQKHNKLTASSVSLLENDWMGAQAMYAVCLMRMERLQKKVEAKTATPSKIRTSSLYSQSQPPPPPPPPRPSLTTPTKSFLYKTSTRTPSPRKTKPTSPSKQQQSTVPSYQPILDTILNRLKLLDNPDLKRNVFYNYDVLGGRAGALQVIFWIRKELSKCADNDSDSELWAQDMVVSIASDMIQQGLATAEQLRQEQYPDMPQETLFWMCDSHGSHKPYLHASRGVVGVLQTLLALHADDWTKMESTIPQAKQYVCNTIDLFCRHKSEADQPFSHKQSENDSGKHNAESFAITDLLDEKKEMDDPVSTNQLAITSRYNRVQPPKQEKKIFQKHVLFKDGNLRPFLSAPDDYDKSVDWFQGATGLAMLLLTASQVFDCRRYTLAAHNLCDSVIFQRGMEIQSASAVKQQTETNSRLAWRSNSSQHRRTLYNLSPSNDDKNTGFNSNSNNDRDSILSKYNSKGPSGMAGMALCFLMLSTQCEGPSNDTASLSLNSIWKNRALHFCQRARLEWMEYLETVPLTTGGWNPYSLYEGTGCLASLSWQLSTAMRQEDNVEYSPQLPLYVTSNHDAQRINLTLCDVCMIPPKKEPTPPPSPPHILRTLLPEATQQVMKPKSPSKPALTEEQQREADSRRQIAEAKLAESRKRRAKAEKEALRRKVIEETARQKRLEEEKERKALEEKKRKAQLEARQHLQVVSRKIAAIKIEEESKRKEEELAKKKAADEAKRDAMLLARKQAQERVEIKRKLKEESEARRAEEYDKKRKADAAAKQARAEEEAKRRQEMAGQLLKAKKEEAELVKERRRQQAEKERLEAVRKKEELRWKEEARKRRDEEREQRRRRLTRIKTQEEASKKRKEEELLKLRVAQEEQRRQKEKQKLLAAEEQRKRREEVLKKKAAAEKQRARDKAKKEKELEELKLKKQLEKASKLEEDRKKLREKQRKQEEAQAKRLREDLAKKEKAEKERLRRIAEAERKKEGNQASKQLTRLGIQPIPTQSCPSTNNAKQTREQANPSRFTLPTRSSVFWSLQSESKIGSSENYEIALVEKEEASVAESKGVVSKLSDLTCDETCSVSLSPSNQRQEKQSHENVFSKPTPEDSVLASSSVPRRRKGVDPNKRIQSLSNIVQGTLELKEQL